MIVSLGSGASQTFIFVAAMLGGMAVYNLTRTREAAGDARTRRVRGRLLKRSARLTESVGGSGR